MRLMQSFSALGLSVLLALPLASLQAQEADLVGLMGSLQYHAHKLQLSLDHDNPTLAGFYAHELEEVTEEVMAYGEYDGFDIGGLTTAMLWPAFERFEEALVSGDLAEAGNRFDNLLNTCNACHTATEHGYIVIQRNPVNPYLQSFEAP